MANIRDLPRYPFLTVGEIPNGRQILIKDGNDKPIINVPLIFDGELSLKTSSDFGSIWDAEPNNLMSLVASSVEIGNFKMPSGQFALQGAQIWQKTEPLEFTIKTNLYMDKDGFNDVVKPSLVLMQTCLPMKETIAERDNIMGLNVALQTLIPPGPNLQAILSTSGMISGDSKIMQDIKNKVRGTYTLEIPPNFIFNNIIIKEVDVTFSKTLDEKGYPISASVDIEFRTMEIATTDMINRILKSSSNGGSN